MCIPQALAHKTLVLLLGVDPSKQLDHPLPTAHPHVTYAYMKYMWKSSRKVNTHTLTYNALKTSNSLCSAPGKYFQSCTVKYRFLLLEGSHPLAFPFILTAVAYMVHTVLEVYDLHSPVIAHGQSIPQTGCFEQITKAINGIG